MISGVTSTGFAFEYDPARLDDFRFVDLLAVADDPEASYLDKLKSISALVTMLLGPELKKALYAHIGERHEGRVPQADLEAAMVEIMIAAGRGAEKN